MAGLTGVFRALSFIGLGLVLVGIGWLYQRLLFPPRPKTTDGAGVTRRRQQLKRHEAELLRADVAPQRAGAEPEAARGLFGNRIAAIAAAAELLPGEADFDALDAEHGVVAVLRAVGRTPVGHVGNAVLADLAAALRAVDAIDAEALPVSSLATSPPCTWRPANAGRRRRA